MKPSVNIHKEILACEKLLEELAKSANSDEFQDIWHRVLGHLERIWTKSVGYYKVSPKWSKWHQKEEAVRKAYPLLLYLTNARGAYEHKADDVTEKTGGGLAISAGSGKPVHIKKMTVSNGQVSGEWDGDLRVTFIPEKVDLKPVTNRGVLHKVPDIHLGKKLPSKDVIVVGQMGMKYYKDLIKRAEEFFADKF